MDELPRPSQLAFGAPKMPNCPKESKEEPRAWMEYPADACSNPMESSCLVIGSHAGSHAVDLALGAHQFVRCGTSLLGNRPAFSPRERLTPSCLGDVVHAGKRKMEDALLWSCACMCYCSSFVLWCVCVCVLFEVGLGVGELEHCLLHKTRSH